MSDLREATVPELSLVVPVYDECENVGELHREITDALRDRIDDYEVLFIDDGSQDGTLDELRLICARDSRVKAVCLGRNFGQSAAVQAGFDLARGRVVVTLDGDLQNDPADIPRLVRHLDEGYDVVSGWRLRRQDRALSRRLPSTVANAMIARLTGVRIHDNGCTLKAYRREVVKRARLYSEMHRFLVPLLTLSGCRIKEVEVNHRPRRFGTTKYGLSRIWKVLLDLLAIKMILRFISHPAAWFAMLAFPFLVAASLAGAGSLYLYATMGERLDFPLVLPSITILLAFAALNLLVSGLFAELVVSVGDYRETDPIVVRVEGPARARHG